MRHLRDILLERQTVNDTIRSFFRARGYVEVETPLLVRSPGMEPNLVPFETTAIEPDGARHKAGLITSPEYSMKKLLGKGMERIFTLTKVFRNGEEFGGSPSGVALRAIHNPEFTMLEWYQQGADYQACMDETEALVREVYAAIGKVPAPQGIERKRCADLFRECVGVDLDTATADDLKAACRRLGIHTDAADTESDLFYRLFLAKVEPTFVGKSLFLYDYPRHQAALSQITPDGRYGQRFELYVDGLELCNGFTELTDADEQRRRFLEEGKERAQAGKTVFPVDETLLALLPSVRQPTFGNALGVDRLQMAATHSRQIADVLAFPAASLFTGK